MSGYSVMYKKIRKFVARHVRHKTKRDRSCDVTLVKPVLALDLDEFYKISDAVIKQKRTLMRHQRLYVLWQAAYQTRNLTEAVVEIGSYKGGSAYFIASAIKHFRKADSEVMVIDTFTGHPAHKLTEEIEPHHKTGLFGDTAYEDVKNYLKPFSNLTVIAGEGTAVIGGWPERRYSLLHLDVDTYLTTKQCLEYFIPRMVSGGVIVIDDFASRKCAGVAQAVNELLPALEGCSFWQMQTEQFILRKN